MQEDDSEYKRFHLILMALDDIGYQGIAKAVTESNTRIDSRGFPRMNKEILERYFAKGKNIMDMSLQRVPVLEAFWQACY